jgi:radical SAM protein with 4Fe4S-binding SPASM domain
MDGSSGATHDGIRGIDGHFASTLTAIELLKSAGYRVQVNTTVMAANLEELPEFAALLKEHAVDIWEVFFLITTGRGTEVAGTTPEENEAVCHFLVDAARHGFTVRTVEAPFFRRVAAERMLGGTAEVAPSSRDLYLRLRQQLEDRLGLPTAPVRAPSAATRDGKGIIFVAANGDVNPSGFLPLRLGNVRTQRLSAIYRQAPLLQRIRAATFSGVCGRCAFAQLCGGSRSRAFAVTGDPLGDDPGCVELAAAALAGYS